MQSAVVVETPVEAAISGIRHPPITSRRMKCGGGGVCRMVLPNRGGHCFCFRVTGESPVLASAENRGRYR